jgi:serine/threonine-protein kinase
MVVGKPGYVAPEVLQNRPVDERGDVFACGMLLYRMLAGRLPFSQRGADLLWAERFAERVTTDEYAPPSTHVPDLLPELSTIVARAIRRKPEERYQSAREMQNRLLAAEALLPDRVEAPVLGLPGLGGHDPKSSPAVAAGTTELRVGAPPLKRSGLAWGLLAGAIVAAIGVAAWIFLGTRGGNEADRPAGLETVAAAGPVADAGPDALPAEPPSSPAAKTTADEDPAGAAPEDGRAQEVPSPDGPTEAAAPTVRISFEGLPRGAALLVGGKAVEGTSLYLPAAAGFLPFEVTAAGFLPYRGSFEPAADRVIRVEMVASRPSGTGRRPPGARDAGAATRDAGTIQGRTGTTFVTEYE